MKTFDEWGPLLILAVVALGVGFTVGAFWSRDETMAALNQKHPDFVMTRQLDTLPTGTVVACYHPAYHEGIACVLDPAMQGATP